MGAGRVIRRPFCICNPLWRGFRPPGRGVALDDDFAVLGCPAHAAAGFEQAGQFPQVGIRADETFDERDGLAAPLLAVEPDAQVLSFGGEGSICGASSVSYLKFGLVE